MCKRTPSPLGTLPVQSVSTGRPSTADPPSYRCPQRPPENFSSCWSGPAPAHPCSRAIPATLGTAPPATIYRHIPTQLTQAPPWRSQSRPRRRAAPSAHIRTISTHCESGFGRVPGEAALIRPLHHRLTPAIVLNTLVLPHIAPTWRLSPRDGQKIIIHHPPPSHLPHRNRLNPL